MKQKCFFLFILFFISSCISFPKKNLVYHTIDLNLDTNIGNTNKTILISNIKVFPPYDTKKIYYSFRDHELQNYSYHLWASPISHMLLRSLVICQNPKSKIQFITGDLNNTHYTYDLKIVVKKFLHRYYGSKSYAVVDMIFIVSKMGVKKQREYNVKVLCKENTPYGAVVAFNKALNKIMNDFFNSI